MPHGRNGRRRILVMHRHIWRLALAATTVTRHPATTSIIPLHPAWCLGAGHFVLSKMGVFPIQEYIPVFWYILGVFLCIPIFLGIHLSCTIFRCIPVYSRVSRFLEGDRFVCAPSVRSGSFVRHHFLQVRLCAISSSRFVCAPSFFAGSDVRLKPCFAVN